MSVELVAKPMPTMTAAGFSRKVAMAASNLRWTAVSPLSARLLHTHAPCSRSALMTYGVTNGSTPPKPR